MNCLRISQKGRSFWPILKQCIIINFKRIKMHIFFQMWNGDFSLPWMPFQNQKTTKEFHCSYCLYQMISSFLDNISKQCKWIMLLGPALLNDRGHIKTLKIITRTVDFGIPTLEIFLNKKIFLRTVGIIEILCNLHVNIRILLIF